MARWLRFANTLGALELLAADVCAAAAARPHCLAPDDLARQFILLSRALHLFVDRARSPASLGAVRYRRRRLGERRWRAPRSGSFAPRRQRARILPGARRFVLTVARSPGNAAAVSTNRRHCRRALRQCGGAPSAQLGLDTASYRRGNSAQDWVNSG